MPICQTFGNVSPKEKKDFQITGGSIITKLGAIEKRAKYGEIEFVYQDAALTQKSDRWAFCLTSGEIILPRSIFIDPPKDRFTPNSFSILPINEGYVLLSIDPAKSQRVCMLENADGSAYPTVGFNGTTVAYANKQYERKSDGWYEGQNKVSD